MEVNESQERLPCGTTESEYGCKCSEEWTEAKVKGQRSSTTLSTLGLEGGRTPRIRSNSDVVLSQFGHKELVS